MKFIVTITQRYETTIDVVIDATSPGAAQSLAKRMDEEKRFDSLWDAVSAKRAKNYDVMKGENP